MSDHDTHVHTAAEAAEAVARIRDYRGKYVHLGIAGVHVLAALSTSLDRLAAALEQPTKENP